MRTPKPKRVARRGSQAQSAHPAASQRREIFISWKTILKLLSAVLFAFVAFELRHLFADLLLALIISITLWPMIRWSRKHRWPEWLGLSCITLILLGAVALGLGLLIPTITHQAATLVETLPKLKEDIVKYAPAQGAVHNFTQQFLASPMFADSKPLVAEIVAFGGTALKGLIEFLVIVITSIYFLSDGERVYRWLLAFLPARHRKKLGAAAPEIAGVVSGYMSGQLITSLLCGAYAFCVLSLLHVPDAALFAVIAGFCDVLPLIGFFIAVIPAVASAAFVSPATAVSVAVLYSVYHLIENYFIVPRIYGRRLGLSSLTVLVCCMMAGIVGGVLGIILILPIVASYPIIERTWLRPHLEPDTVQKHDALDKVNAHG
ncbi:AI-2E family transporter [Prosthecobacter sp.]|uniref:AI-2E family transporter n=1 Tax=Prosthecobacter sp. TaxID=1965333 RepID=UPI00378413C4